MKKRILSLLLAAVMLFGLLPPAFAAESGFVFDPVPVEEIATDGPMHLTNPNSTSNEDTAFVPALVSSALPCERFTFEGFLPQKKGRASRLAELATEPRTMIFYESPYRVVKTLGQFAETFGADRPMAAVREISKVFEECVRGTIAEVQAHFAEHEPKGEFVLLVGGAPEVKKKKKERGPKPDAPAEEDQ